jgi:hypothetical protein
MKDNLIFTFGNYEEAIINAIVEAERDNKRIVYLGLPLRVQKTIRNVERADRLKTMVGIKVRTTKVLYIATEFSLFQPVAPSK